MSIAMFPRHQKYPPSAPVALRQNTGKPKQNRVVFLSKRSPFLEFIQGIFSTNDALFARGVQ